MSAIEQPPPEHASASPADRSATVELGLLEVAPDAIVVCDAESTIVLANARAEALTGRSGGTLVGRPLAELFPGGWEGDAEVSRADGTFLPVDVNLSRVTVDSGTLAVAILRDATERRQIEADLRRSHERLSEAQELARLGSWEWDIPGNRVVWSDELYRIYGFEPQSFEPTYEKFLGCVHPDDRESVDERNRKAFADHLPFEDVKRIVRPDGSEFLMRTQGEVVTDGHGNPLRMLGVCEDVTAEVRAKQAEARLAEIVQSANDAIYTVDLDDRITSWNPAAERLFGYTASEVIGEPIAMLMTESDRELEEREHLRERLLANLPIDELEFVRRRKSGEIVEVSATISALRDAQGKVVGASAIARDMSERRRTEARLEYLASHDGLTGLYNRRRFEEELAAACKRAGRDAVPGALVVLDLDDFKYVNDNFGHQAGDALLTDLAAGLTTRLRATDTLARLGGDEFAVLAAPMPPEQVGELAANLLSVVRQQVFTLAGQTVRMTASVGAVSFDGSSDATEVLAEADGAMYDSKHAGRDRTTLRRPGDAGTPRRAISWEHQIRTALEEDRLELYCQPILELATGKLTQAELLLRMRSDGEMFLPGAFLGAAERTGLIHQVDRWVVGRAIEIAAAHPSMTFEINLSGQTVDDETLPAFVASALKASGADPRRLVFEVTETAAVGNIHRARELARSLAAIGCTFAIDDFGAGFSTFYYLKHFPAQYLKIDGDFVRSPRSRTDDLVIESIVRIARDLGKCTIAEFVGDEDTLERMRELGVDFAQGFHIARPFPVAELVS